ncbi:hypothetical protein K461DRAFT_292463 [Myriangium duriaei CBS 260.36]|uniref:Uncharacterized protein n=1 Tax=Myriangium duriaei CBS 260.36 TaxID=1168546 RepID=A0A9P4ML21_9PEZI|nr:hypothetical protein K461DRAFT_292463 [Myriangium duriaei CBS 260.36]
MYDLCKYLLYTLMLAATALGTKMGKLAYAGKYFDGEKVQRVVHSQRIYEDRGQRIAENIALWSNGDYRATTSKSGIITIYNAYLVDTKDQAEQVVLDMELMIDLFMKKGNHW